MKKIQPLPKKTQSTDGFIFLPDKTGFSFISAAGELLLKVNADGKCIHTALNHTQWRRASVSHCLFLTKACFLAGWPQGASRGPHTAVVQNWTPWRLCSAPESLSPPCSVEKLLIHTFSLLLLSEPPEVTPAQDSLSPCKRPQQGAPLPGTVFVSTSIP